MHILIITLGKGLHVNPSVPDGQRRYRTATYKFADGTVSKPNAFFGLALLDWLRQHHKVIDRLLVIGTRRSMWDAWLELESVEQAAGKNATELYERLASVVADGTTETSILAPLETAMSGALGLAVTLRVIPEARDSDEQATVLDTLAECVPPNARITLDVTHGLRHLPMLQLLSAFHLQLTRACVVDALFYGALELSRKPGVESPVIRLDFGNDILRWFKAVHLAEGCLDLAAIADCLPAASRLGKCLRATSWHVGLGQVDHATTPANEALQLIDAEMASGIASLFREKLRTLLAWARLKSLAERQLALGQRFLLARDYLRAAILLHEAFVSHHVEKNATAGRYAPRESATTRIRARQSRLDKNRGSSIWGDPWDEAYRAMGPVGVLRNALAHGTTPADPRLSDLLHEEGRGLHGKLERWMARIRQCVTRDIPPDPPEAS